MNTVPKISISLPKEHYRALEEIARNKGMTVNEYIKQLLITIAEIHIYREAIYKLDTAHEQLNKLLET